MTLRHPNILQFLGANTLDDKPFVVMPLFPYNSREFLRIRPTWDPLYIVSWLRLILSPSLIPGCPAASGYNAWPRVPSWAKDMPRRP
jgi:hypothetical protein